MSQICAWFYADFSKVKTVQGFEMQLESLVQIGDSICSSNTSCWNVPISI